MPRLARIRRWVITRIVLEATAIFITIAVMSRVLNWFVPDAPPPLHG